MMTKTSRNGLVEREKERQPACFSERMRQSWGTFDTASSLGIWRA